MPHLPRLPVFPVTGENSILTAGGAALRIPAKEKNHKFIGELAPEIKLNDHLGRLVSLHATIALGRPIILYFFPLAGSPHCTKESCSFRDALGNSPIFNDLNAVVIGVSQDDPSRQKKFVDEHRLGFRLLHDPDREVLNEWGVGRTMMGLVDARCTFVIDHEGIVRAMAEGVWDYQGHRNFAEKWLVRIEHELAGKERYYFEHNDDVLVAGPDDGKNVQVMYGGEGSAAGGGIGVAPRYGAALVAAKKDEVKKLKDGLKKSKSKRNLKEWFVPRSNSSGSFDEPLHVEPYGGAKNPSFDLALKSRGSLRSVKSQPGQPTKFKHSASGFGLVPGKNGTPPLPSAAAKAEALERDANQNPTARSSGWGTSSSGSNGSGSTAETSVASVQVRYGRETPIGTAVATGDSMYVKPNAPTVSSNLAFGQRSSSLSMKSGSNDTVPSRRSRQSKGPEDVPREAWDDEEMSSHYRKWELIPRQRTDSATTATRPSSEQLGSECGRTVRTPIDDLRYNSSTPSPRGMASLPPRPSRATNGSSSDATYKPEAFRSYKGDALRDSLDGSSTPRTTANGQVENGVERSVSHSSAGSDNSIVASGPSDLVTARRVLVSKEATASSPIKATSSTNSPAVPKRKSSSQFGSVMESPSEPAFGTPNSWISELGSSNLTLPRPLPKQSPAPGYALPAVSLAARPSALQQASLRPTASASQARAKRPMAPLGPTHKTAASHPCTTLP